MEALEEGAKVFLFGNIGPHAFEILTNGKARTYLTRKMTDEEALEKLNKNVLELLTEPIAKRSIMIQKPYSPYILQLRKPKNLD